MSQEQPMQAPPLAARRRNPIRLEQLRRAPGLKVLGLPEFIGLAGAILIAVITLVAYFYFYVPAHSRLRSAQVARDRLQGQLRASETNFKETTTTREAVDKIDASLRDFESNWLANSGPGRMTLYSELNNVIRSNGLRNTSGPTYTALQPIGSKLQQTAVTEKQSNAKWQSIYPGIAVSVTVEGPYQNVRHFVRDIESSRQFLIINAVELESLSQSAASQDLRAAQSAPPPSRSGKAAPPAAALPTGPRIGWVSLRLDMATYFQRPNTDIASTP